MNLQERIQELIDSHCEGQENGCYCHNSPPCGSCTDHGYGMELAEFIALSIENEFNKDYALEKEIRDLKEVNAGLKTEIAEALLDYVLLKNQMDELRSKGDVLGKANRTVMERFRL